MTTSRTAGGAFIVLTSFMFIPFCNNFWPPFSQHPSDFSDLMRPEPSIKSKREVVHPDFAFGASLEYMHMNPFRQIITIEADTIAVLEKHRGHSSVRRIVSS